MYFDERKKTSEESLTMRLAWIIILFVISSTVAQTSITFGGYLQDLGNFLTTSYTTDTNTFLVGVIAGGLVLLQAPLIVIYKIIAEVISIVALSLFINFLGERMGFGSFIPFIRDALPRDDSSISALPIDNLPIDENFNVRSYIDKNYLVRVYPDGHEIKTVRTFQETGKEVESNQFVDRRRSHRKINSRRRNNFSRWRRGRSDSEFRATEINHSSPQNRNVPTEYGPYFVHSNEQTSPSIGGNRIGGNHIGGNPISGNPISGNPIGGNHIGGNPIGGNPIGGNPIGGSHIGGNHVGGQQIGGNHVGGNHVGRNANGGNAIGGNPIGGNPIGGNHVGGNHIGGNVNSKNNLFVNKKQNSVKSKSKISGYNIFNQISDAGNYFIKNRVNILVNKVLESDIVKTIKNSLTKNISNFIWKSIGS